MGCIFNQINISRSVTTLLWQQRPQTNCYFYQATPRHISEDCELLNHSDGNTKPHKINPAHICIPFVFKVCFNIILMPKFGFYIVNFRFLN